MSLYTNVILPSSAHAHWVEGAYSLRHERMTIFIYRPYSLFMYIYGDENYVFTFSTMPQMNKTNARAMLQRTLTRFKQVTGQRVAVVFTWEGGLSVLGNSLFTQFINDNSTDVWKTLACPSTNSSIPAQELEMAASIELIFHN